MSTTSLTAEKVQTMLEACSTGKMTTIQQLIVQNSLYVSQQDDTTGTSPLMVASHVGNMELVQALLNEGAPWNAVDRKGKCAGDYATDAEHWNIVNLLVDWGTRSELILGTTQRDQRNQPPQPQQAEQDSSTKPNYLNHRLRYNEDGTALLDDDNDAVMMEWERPIMKAHASVLMESSSVGRRVLNVGFGMGIIDSALQEYNPSLHIIIEAHPKVYQTMLEQKWDQKPNVQIYHGKWQDVVPQLIQRKVELDAIFYDTYAEHAFDMEDFHRYLPQLLCKRQGIYSFFNGLAPDNLFFHGVACNVVKLQLSQLGFDTEFLQCQIEANSDNVWDGIRRKYWHNRDTYYLPRVTWNQEFLGRKTKANGATIPMDNSGDVDMETAPSTTKRQKMVL